MDNGTPPIRPGFIEVVEAPNAKIRFGYWNIRGLGQPIRLICAYANIPAKDERYNLKPREGGGWDYSEWMAFKKTDYLSKPAAGLNLPYLIDNTDAEQPLVLIQSQAIYRHLARSFKPSLLGKDIREQSLVDMWLDQLVDFKGAPIGICYSKTNPTEFEPAILDYMQTRFPAAAKAIIGQLGSKKFLVSTDEPTLVDFSLYEFINHIMAFGDMAKDAIGEHDYATLVNYVKNFDAQPWMVEYCKTPGYASIQHQWNNKSAVYEGDYRNRKA